MTLQSSLRQNPALFVDRLLTNAFWRQKFRITLLHQQDKPWRIQDRCVRTVEFELHLKNEEKGSSGRRLLFTGQ